MSQIPYETKYNGRNGTKGYFVEVFINGKYHGLYCMTDKVNRKLLNVKKAKTDKENNTNHQRRDVQMRTMDRRRIPERLLFAIDERRIMERMGTRLPRRLSLRDRIHAAEKPHRLLHKDLRRGVYRGTCTHFYMQNLIDYHTFYLAVGLRDNTMKNSFMSINDINSETRMLITLGTSTTSYGGEWEGSYP